MRMPERCSAGRLEIFVCSFAKHSHDLRIEFGESSLQDREQRAWKTADESKDCVEVIIRIMLQGLPIPLVQGRCQVVPRNEFVLADGKLRLLHLEHRLQTEVIFVGSRAEYGAVVSAGHTEGGDFLFRTP